MTQDYLDAIRSLILDIDPPSDDSPHAYTRRQIVEHLTGAELLLAGLVDNKKGAPPSPSLGDAPESPTSDPA